MAWYSIALFLLVNIISLTALVLHDNAYRLTKRDADNSGENLKKFQKQALNAHNNYRAQHCVPALELDDDISQGAQAYAEKLVELGKLVHSTDRNGLGENLYKTRSTAPLDDIDGAIPTTAWYNEIKKYNFQNGGFSGDTGHFTQVVWKNSKKLGIGIAFSDDKTTAYVVARYSPAGNVLQNFDANVLEPLCKNN